MPRVTFLPSGRSFVVRAGGSLLRAAVRAHMPLARSCRGVGACAMCRVRIVDGAEHVEPMGEVEAALAARDPPLRPGERFACLARVRGDVTITTSYW